MRDLILITGSSGKVGSILVRNFRKHGFEVVLLGHDSLYSNYLIPDDIEISSFRRIIVVHSGQPKAPRSTSTRIRYLQASFDLIKQTSKLGLKFIYISSLSAHANNRSNYSKEKMAVENFSLMNDGVVIKLGILTGAPGNYADKLAKVRKYVAYSGLDFLLHDSLFINTSILDLERLATDISEGKLIRGTFSYSEPAPIQSHKNNPLQELIRLVLRGILIVFSYFGSGRSDAVLSLIDGMKVPEC